MNTAARFGLLPMRRRDAAEAHRTASPLELFFDLVFVVAVSLSSAQLHVDEFDGIPAQAIGAYLMVFFAIWWAWMNFTWFASAFAVDDWLHRVVTIVQMSGALVLAAGAPTAMRDGDFTIITIGYVIMRLALVTQWLRAAVSEPGLRRVAFTYAIGITFVQMLWVARLALPDEGGAASFLVVAALELALPVVARARSATLWHPEHIAERYGLFTLILLGESVLASTVAVVDALAHVDHFGHLALIAGCGLTLAAGMWWVYFHGSPSERLTTMREALTYGYGHYVIFAAAGAFSAGIEVTVGHDTTSGGLTGVGEALCLTLPVAVFLVMVWLIVLRHELPPLASAMFVGLSVLLALTALLPSFFVAAAVVMVAVVAVVEVARVRARRFV